jgi:hypothetical protein
LFGSALSPSRVDEAARRLSYPGKAGKTCRSEEMGMTRLTLTLAASLLLGSLASAAVAPSTRPSRVGRDILPPAAQRAVQAREQPPAQETQEEFHMTAQTAVLLNDRPCAYGNIPAHARIVWMEVAADRKTILRVYFRTGK